MVTSDKQEQMNSEALQSYDDLVKAQRDKITTFYDFEVDSALTYKCSDSTVDDWQDSCLSSAQLIIELQRHAKKVAEHLTYLNTLETTKDLRDYTLNRFDVSSITLSHTAHT